MRAGRSFLRRLIDLSTEVKHMDHYVRLNRDARSDIEWWAQFSSSWNGVAIMQDPLVDDDGEPDVSNASDGILISTLIRSVFIHIAIPHGVLI